MGRLERLFHAITFEVLAVSLSVIGLAIFTDHNVSNLSGTMIVIATIAMIWNVIFNWVFDKFVPGQKENRSLKIRIVQVLLFEAGLLFATVPVMAYILNISILEAFAMDIGVTIFITIYAFFFNLAYDHIRAYIVARRSPTMAVFAISKIKPYGFRCKERS
ncbi:PACE efflux transporter [Shewanella schlegeliana]|uniref:PACE efflux transporter n=1 Tax=Shewanella schlegeliana TaxID=190308 RepID=A0ABS1SXR6_9GAMM|nr:PACE efflux transporter [Shewanella schlegeliana]MBL4913194.1 PACE efflux transporter [Shewanella schlegeliana]MCL1109150.1 PACE efflux transporter [Shewanella schlegeliana]GIU24099.1 membrane protein [Shewanella schlegeliana]